jgi:hypothetical protein
VRSCVIVLIAGEASLDHQTGNLASFRMRQLDRGFTLAELGRVKWGFTVKVAAARGFAGGLVWAAILSVPESGMTEQQLAGLPIFLSIISLPIGFTLWLVGSMLAPARPLLAALTIGLYAAGDPLVYVVNRAFPWMLNVADFRLFHAQPLIFVVFPD